MVRSLHSIDFYTFRKFGVALLALSWAAGLGFGDSLFRLTGSDLASQMPLAVLCQPSIFGLLTSFLLPFLFSAFAVYLSAPKLLYPIAFIKALLFGYVSAGVFEAFGEAGWLVRILVLFSDISGVIALYHYWLRHISGLRLFSGGVLVGYLIPVFVIVLADYYYISPLLQRVLL